LHHRTEANPPTPSLQATHSRVPAFATYRTTAGPFMPFSHMAVGIFGSATGFGLLAGMCERMFGRAFGERFKSLGMKTSLTKGDESEI